MVVIPLGLTDFAGALRELIAAFRDGAGLVGDGVNLVRRRQAGVAAGELDDLSFAPNGVCRSLRQIAEGRGVEADVQAIEKFDSATAESVTAKVGALNRYRETVRKQCGRAASEKLHNLIDGPSGKFVIRYEINAVALMWRDGKQQNDISMQADKVLKMIAEFNAHLTDLHDMIFPPRGAPK